MSYIDDLGDELARDVIAAQKELDTDQLVADVAKILEASSSAMHEAFMTAVRVRMAEERARKMLTGRLAAARQAAPQGQ